MVVYDFHIMGIAAFPAKTNPPLAIDPDAVSAFSVALEPFQSVGRRHP